MRVGAAAAPAAGLAAGLALALAGGGSAGGAQPEPLSRLAGETIVGALAVPPRPSFLARVRRGELGGVILVGRWPSKAAILAVTSRLQAVACAATGEPLLVGVDQEGGAVRRLPWAAPARSARALGVRDDPGQVRREGAAAARALRAAGVDVDFAPVADVPASAASFLGDRAFSSDPARAARLVSAFVTGLQDAGVAATAKHFPGLGAATASTDDGPVAVRASAAALRRSLAPFRAAIDAGAQLVMVSSASYPALDPPGAPAALSRPIVTGLLRDTLGFVGVVVTDALDAPALAPIPHAPARAIGAGVDLLLYTSGRASEAGYASLLADASRSSALRAKVTAAAERVRALKEWLTAGGGPACPS